MTVTLREVTRENWQPVVRLKTRKDQEHFVAPNAYSLVEAKYEPGLAPLAIYAGEKLVGFTMWGVDPADGRYWIVRLMVDAEYQGQGYGRATMVELIRRIGGHPLCTDISISFEPDNTVADRLYASLGFEKTGEVVGGELVARLHLRDGGPVAS